MPDTIIYLRDIPAADSVQDDATILGVQQNGIGARQERQFTLAQLRAYFAGQDRKQITVLTVNISTTTYANDTLQDDFFDVLRYTLEANNQTYQLNADYTQDVDAKTITFTNDAAFRNGQYVTSRT